MKEIRVLKFENRIVNFTINCRDDTIAPLCYVQYDEEQQRLKMGKLGSPLYLDRRIHKVFLQFENESLSLVGTIKLEFKDGMLFNAVFFAANSELLLKAHKNEKVSNDNIPGRVLLG